MTEASERKHAALVLDGLYEHLASLVACPFCGQRDSLDIEDYGGPHAVRCYNCAISGPWSDTIAEAAAKWNDRVPPWQPIETAPTSTNDNMVHQVLVSVKGDVGAAWLYFNGRFGQDHAGTIQPDAWMPLPDPPKEKL